MATSMSGNVESYIGSFISLITNSDIRYEGFLFQLNPNYTTIALRNVKSFGTEGRRKDGSQVPPSEGIYEYIYFKGTDIKDLQVKSSPHRQSTFNLPDDPAIIQQSHFSLPTSSPVSLSTSGALQMENISHNAQSALHFPLFQGNHSLHSSMECSPSSSLPSSPLNNRTPAIPTYWPGFHQLPSLSEGLIVSHPSPQRTNSSLMNMHLSTNSPNGVEPHHTLISPISPGSQYGIHAPQKSPVFSSSRIPLMTPPLATGSQDGFAPVSPGVQNGLFPVPQMPTIGSLGRLPSVPPSSATSSLNGFPPAPPLSATYSQISHKLFCSQDRLRPVGSLSTIGSLDGLPSLPSSSVPASHDSFRPLLPLSTAYSLIPPLSPGSPNGLLPVPLLSVTGSSDALRSSPPSSAAVNGFSLATPSPAVHCDAGLFSMPAFNIAPTLLSNINFTDPSTPADLKINLTSSSSTSPHVNTATTSVKEIVTSEHGPDSPCSSMLISMKPTGETRDFVDNNPMQPSDLLLQQEQKQLPSSHSLRIINDYYPVQVSASVALSSRSKNVKEPPQQIVKLRANRLQGDAASSQCHNTYHSQRSRGENRDMLQGRHSDRGYKKEREKLPNDYKAKARVHEKVRDEMQNGRRDQGYGKGRKNLPNGAFSHAQYGYRSHAKARRHEVKKDKDALQGGRHGRGYANGRENLPNGAVLHTQYGYRAKARGHEVNGPIIQNSHSNKKPGGDHRSNGFVLSTHRPGRAYPSGGTRALRPVEKFTEDFNFEAMNEKFNKEEVWGLLGESTATKSEHRNEVIKDGPVKVDNKPVYCKDDFFDTLSTSTLDQRPGRGRGKLSERRRIDSETFGEIQKLSERGRIDNETFGEIKKHQRGRGIQGPRRAGGSQGSYRGRGYDHPGRGRGRTVWSRVT